VPNHRLNMGQSFFGIDPYIISIIFHFVSPPAFADLKLKIKIS